MQAYRSQSYRSGDLKLYTYNYKGLCVQVDYYIDEDNDIIITNATLPRQADEEIDIDVYALKTDKKYQILRTVITEHIIGYS